MATGAAAARGRWRPRSSTDAVLVTRALSLAGPRGAVRLPTRPETPIVALRLFLKQRLLYIDVAMTSCARLADVNRTARPMQTGVHPTRFLAFSASFGLPDSCNHSFGAPISVRSSKCSENWKRRDVSEKGPKASVDRARERHHPSSPNGEGTSADVVGTWPGSRGGLLDHT